MLTASARGGGNWGSLRLPAATSTSLPPSKSNFQTCGVDEACATLSTLPALLASEPPAVEGQLRRRRRLTYTWERAELRGTVLVLYSSRWATGLFAQGVARSGSGGKVSGRRRLHDVAGAGKIETLVGSRKGVHPFAIYLGNRRLQLAAQTAEARAAWVQALNHARSTVGHADLRLLALVGEGHFGKVMVAQRVGCSGREGQVALKEMQLVPDRDGLRPELLTERLLLSSLPEHPFLITLQLAFRYGNCLYLGLDFMQGGDLFELLRRGGRPPMDLPAAQFYLRQVASALRFLHAHAIIYRDLKPENVLLDGSGNVRLADLGLARRLLPRGGGLERAHTLCGTCDYVPPEMLRRELYGTSVDFWQLGCLAYELYAGHGPFWEPPPRAPPPQPGGKGGGSSAPAPPPSTDAAASAARILGGEYTRPGRMEDEAWSLVQALLAAEQHARLGVGDPEFGLAQRRPAPPPLLLPAGTAVATVGGAQDGGLLLRSASVGTYRRCSGRGAAGMRSWGGGSCGSGSSSGGGSECGSVDTQDGGGAGAPSSSLKLLDGGCSCGGGSCSCSGGGGSGWEDVFEHPFFAGTDWRAVEAREPRPPRAPLPTDGSLVENFNLKFTSRAPRWGADPAQQPWSGGAKGGETRQRLLFEEELKGFVWVRESAVWGAGEAGPTS